MTFDWTSDLIEAVISAGVNGLWQGFLLAGLVWMILELWQKRRDVNPSTRYAVWSLVLIIIVGLHGVNAIKALDASRIPETQIEWESWRVELPTNDTEWSSRESMWVDREDAAALAQVASPDQAAQFRDPLPSPVLLDVTHDTVGLASPAIALPAFVGRLAPFLVGVWALVGLLFLVRLGRGLAGIHRLKRESRMLSAEHQDRLRTWMKRTGVRRPVVLMESIDVKTPVAAGILQPMILLPSGLVRQLSDEEFDQVILHELAHLSRFDDVSILFQRLVEAVFFHHPAVHWIGNRLAEQREMACDAWVVERTGSPRSYVRSLKRVVELQLTAVGSPFIPGMAVRKGHLRERVRRVMGQRVGSSRYSGEQMAVAGGLIALVAVLFWLQAPVFGLVFGNDQEVAVERSEGPPPPPVPATPEAPSSPVPPVPPVPPIPPMPAVPAVPPTPPIPATDLLQATAPVPPTPSIADPSRVEDLFREVYQANLFLSRASSSLNSGSSNVIARSYSKVPGTDDVLMRFDPGSGTPDVRAAVAVTSLPARVGRSVIRFHPSIIPEGELLEVDMLVDGAYRVYSTSDFDPTLPDWGVQQSIRRAVLGSEGQPDLSVASWIKLLGVTSKMSSSGEKGKVLRDAVRRLPDDERVLSAYIKSAASISSSSGRGATLSAILARDGLTQTPYIELIDAIETIGSSSDRSAALLRVVDRMPDNDKVKDALVEAAEHIPSSSERTRVLRAIIQKTR